MQLIKLDSQRVTVVMTKKSIALHAWNPVNVASIPFGNRNWGRTVSKVKISPSCVELFPNSGIVTSSTERSLTRANVTECIIINGYTYASFRIAKTVK